MKRRRDKLRHLAQQLGRRRPSWVFTPGLTRTMRCSMPNLQQIPRTRSAEARIFLDHLHAGYPVFEVLKDALLKSGLISKDPK